MISIIFGLVIALIYAFTAENPGALATIGMGLFAWSYLQFMQYSLALYAVMKVITGSPKLQEEFLAAAKAKSEN